MLPEWLRLPEPPDPYPEARHVGYQDEPIVLNYGYGYRPFTVEDACEWAERRACEVLG